MYMAPWMAPWYACYVLLFNMLVGPVFSAGAVTSERERETLELLLTTILSPWQILWGKLFSGLRISVVLTSFLVWPLLLACLLPPWTYWADMGTMFGYVAIIAVSSLTTTVTALFCSVIFRKTTVSMMTTYVVILALYGVPLVVEWFARLLFPLSPITASIHRLTFSSPFAACFSLPLKLPQASQTVGAASGPAILANWPVFLGYLAFYVALNVAILGSILWLFNKRWRVST
jgi:ABC-type transport system involved in multi-copper enzyme maturation permease subunit